VSSILITGFNPSLSVIEHTKNVSVADNRGKSWPGLAGVFAISRLPTDYAGYRVLTISSQVSLSGAEIRIYDLDNAPAGSLGTELAGVESNIGSTFGFSGGIGNSVWIQIMLSGYEEYGQQVVVPATDSGLYALLHQDLNN